MFALRPFESMTSSLAFVADPWATCSSIAECRYQARPSYTFIPITRPAVPVVRRVPVPPRPVQLQDRVRIVREQRGVAVLIELPGFSKNDIKIDVKAEEMNVAASTTPSFYYPRGATFFQTFRLGTNIDADAITASFQGGVPTVRMPYKAPNPTGPRRVVVNGPALPPRKVTAIPIPAPQADDSLPAMSREEKASKWVEIHHSGANKVDDEDGSIEDCEV